MRRWAERVPGDPRSAQSRAHQRRQQEHEEQRGASRGRHRGEHLRHGHRGDLIVAGESKSRIARSDKTNRKHREGSETSHAQEPSRRPIAINQQPAGGDARATSKVVNANELVNVATEVGSPTRPGSAPARSVATGKAMKDTSLHAAGMSTFVTRGWTPGVSPEIPPVSTASANSARSASNSASKSRSRASRRARRK